MKVILLQEIKGQGGEGDVVEVKRGYAVNYLLRNKFAIEATKGNLKQLELRKHNIAKRETERLDSSEKIQAALEGHVLTIPARVGEEGQLFGSVTTQHIADALNAELELAIDRKKIDQHAPIKTAGEHTVTISIYRDVKATLTIKVVDEKLSEANEAAEAQAPAGAEPVEAAEVAAGEAAEAEAESASEAAPVVEEAAAEDLAVEEAAEAVAVEAASDEAAENVDDAAATAAEAEATDATAEDATAEDIATAEDAE